MDKIDEVRNGLIEARKQYEQAVSKRDALLIELSETYTVTQLAKLFGMKHQNVSKVLNSMWTNSSRFILGAPMFENRHKNRAYPFG